MHAHALLLINASIQQEFAIGAHTCKICYLEVAGKDFIFLSCGDCYCSECLSQFVGTFVQEGSLDSIICPNLECRAPLLPTGTCLNYTGRWYNINWCTSTFRYKEQYRRTTIPALRSTGASERTRKNGRFHTAMPEV